MSVKAPGPNPAILILSEQSDEYARQLTAALGPEVDLAVSKEPSQALERYAGQAVVLGEPAPIAQVVDRLPGVRWVQSTWAGVKPLIDLGPRLWQLTGIKGIFGPQMSEYVVGCLLAHELKLERRAEAQRRRAWDTVDSGSLRGKCAGVMGTGSIGSHIAGVLSAFGITTRGLNRNGHPAERFDRVFPVEALPEFLTGLDYLVSALPETAATNGLIDTRALGFLPPHAVFVNVGRGNVVDEAALANALCAGTLGAAALDVFEIEPLPADSPLWSAPRIRITAHVAARSMPGDIAQLFAENYRRFREGAPLQFLVDPDRGY